MLNIFRLASLTNKLNKFKSSVMCISRRKKKERGITASKSRKSKIFHEGKPVDHQGDESHDASSNVKDEFHGFADADTLKPSSKGLKNLIEELEPSFEGQSPVITSPAESGATAGSRGGQYSTLIQVLI